MTTDTSIPQGQAYTCIFWDGARERNRTIWASNTDELENQAYGVAFQEGWQMIGYDLAEEEVAA